MLHAPSSLAESLSPDSTTATAINALRDRFSDGFGSSCGVVPFQYWLEHRNPVLLADADDCPYTTARI